MNRAELQAWLDRYPPDMPVMLLDGSNGAGVPRTLNFSHHHTVTAQDADDTADCEGLEMQRVAVLGYGCY